MSRRGAAPPPPTHFSRPGVSSGAGNRLPHDQRAVRPGGLLGARLAYAPAEHRRLRMVESIGIGALAWSVVDTLGASLLFDGRADQFAWALAFAAMLFLPAALAGSPPALAGLLGLLSCAYWAK